MQEGYGFLTFASLNDAQRVCANFANSTIDGITLFCALTHQHNPNSRKGKRPGRGGGGRGQPPFGPQGGPMYSNGPMGMGMGGDMQMGNTMHRFSAQPQHMGMQGGYSPMGSVGSMGMGMTRNNPQMNSPGAHYGAANSQMHAFAAGGNMDAPHQNHMSMMSNNSTGSSSMYSNMNMSSMSVANRFVQRNNNPPSASSSNVFPIQSPQPQQPSTSVPMTYTVHPPSPPLSAAPWPHTGNNNLNNNLNNSGSNPSFPPSSSSNNSNNFYH
jgi:hypothetical protein